MKTRSKSYLRTFQNTSEGRSEYKQLIGDIRKVVTGGKFVKMFRGVPRPLNEWLSKVTKTKCYSGSSRNNGTRFDVYLLGCFNNKTQRYEDPRFYGWELK